MRETKCLTKKNIILHKRTNKSNFQINSHDAVDKKEYKKELNKIFEPINSKDSVKNCNILYDIIHSPIV